jgi:acyl carrier protein
MQALLNERPETRVSTLVMRMLEKRGAAKRIGVHESLREAGLTSLDMVNLMLAVEGEFDIFIPQEQITPENFRSISTVQGLVDMLLRT